MVAGPTPQLTQIDKRSAVPTAWGLDYPLLSISSRVGLEPEKFRQPAYTVAWLAAVRLQTSASTSDNVGNQWTESTDRNMYD